MKRRKVSGTAVTGLVLLFLLIGAFATVALPVYDAVKEASGGNPAVIAGVMLAVIFALSLLGTAAHFLYRKFTADKRVNAILEATDKVAAGDFSVRLETAHRPRRYDEYDYIVCNLNRMTAELSRTEVLHNDFIANVSHEIKTPLSVMHSYTEVLARENLDEETRIQYAQALRAAASRLTALITNILKLNKLENLEIRPEYTAVNLSESIAEAVLGMEELIEKKGLNLTCDLDENVTVRSVPSLLELIWNNLLSNAVKFTERGGGITVALKHENGEAAVTVSDTGCGISAETGRHIFEKFYQGDTSHAQEGNGLGLPLVKKVIDILGGKISVESEPGAGTSFTVKLRLQN